MKVGGCAEDSCVLETPGTVISDYFMWHMEILNNFGSFNRKQQLHIQLDWKTIQMLACHLKNIVYWGETPGSEERKWAGGLVMSQWLLGRTAELKAPCKKCLESPLQPLFTFFYLPVNLTRVPAIGNNGNSYWREWYYSGFWQRESGDWTCCPEKLWILHPCMCSRSSWIEF